MNPSSTLSLHAVIEGVSRAVQQGMRDCSQIRCGRCRGKMCLPPSIVPREGDGSGEAWGRLARRGHGPDRHWALPGERFSQQRHPREQGQSGRHGAGHGELVPWPRRLQTQRDRRCLTCACQWPSPADHSRSCTGSAATSGPSHVRGANGRRGARPRPPRRSSGGRPGTGSSRCPSCMSGCIMSTTPHASTLRVICVR